MLIIDSPWVPVGFFISIKSSVVVNKSEVEALARAAIDKFGRIDILVNNASAIHLTDTVSTPMKRYDLMHQINTRGTFLVSRTCLPHLQKSDNPHILNLSAPLNMQEKWFKDHVAYTMAKYGMSMCMLGMAEEFRADGIACNALWPRTVIATAAVVMAADLLVQGHYDNVFEAVR